MNLPLSDRERLQLADAAVRRDFLSFQRRAFPVASAGRRLDMNWHPEAIAWRLELIRTGETKRLLVTMPPRHLKSITISVAWAAWMLGRDPGRSFVCVSYSIDLARKHARDCRAIMETEWYRRVFPGTTPIRGGGAELDFLTTKGGGRLSTSSGAMLTGRGGEITIIDDPLKAGDGESETERRNANEWYGHTLMSRLNDQSTGAIVLVVQRLHEDDLAGHFIEVEEPDQLRVPAIAEADESIPIGGGAFHCRKAGELLHPERVPLRRLEALQRGMGSGKFAAQYQQEPVPAEGLHVRRGWFRYFDAEPDRLPGDLLVQSWDTASKEGTFSDWSVCVTAIRRGRQILVLDVLRARLEFPALRRAVIERARRWQADSLLIEDAASGLQLIQMLREENLSDIPRPIAVKPELSKEARFSTQTRRSRPES